VGEADDKWRPAWVEPLFDYLRLSCGVEVDPSPSHVKFRTTSSSWIQLRSVPPRPVFANFSQPAQLLARWGAVFAKFSECGRMGDDPPFCHIG